MVGCLRSHSSWICNDMQRSEMRAGPMTLGFLARAFLVDLDQGKWFHAHVKRSEMDFDK